MVLIHEAKWKIESNTEGMLGGDGTKASARWWEVGHGRAIGAEWAELRECVGF